MLSQKKNDKGKNQAKANREGKWDDRHILLKRDFDENSAAV